MVSPRVDEVTFIKLSGIPARFLQNGLGFVLVPEPLFTYGFDLVRLPLRTLAVLSICSRRVATWQVLVKEPSVEDTISILRGLKEKYESHHGVRILDRALVVAAQLSACYITGERALLRMRIICSCSGSGRTGGLI